MIEEFTPKSDFFIGIDSDGCAFDTMELKQKECFIPTIIKHWGWQSVSKYAREVIEFVNLYSKTRGINRFPALINDFEWLAKRPEVIARGVRVEPPREIIEWMNRETKLGNAALAAEVERTGDPVLKKTLAWSLEVNEVIDAIVGEGVAPFPLVRESLEKAPERPERERTRMLGHPFRFAAHLSVFVGDVAPGQQLVQIAVRLQEKVLGPHDGEDTQRARSQPFGFGKD